MSHDILLSIHSTTVSSLTVCDLGFAASSRTTKDYAYKRTHGVLTPTLGFLNRMDTVAFPNAHASGLLMDTSTSSDWTHLALLMDTLRAMAARLTQCAAQREAAQLPLLGNCRSGKTAGRRLLRRGALTRTRGANEPARTSHAVI